MSHISVALRPADGCLPEGIVIAIPKQRIPLRQDVYVVVFRPESSDTYLPELLP